MRAKDYLLRIEVSRSRIARVERRLQELAEQRLSLQGVRYDRDPVQTSNDGQGFTKLADAYADFEAELKERKLRHEKLADRIEEEIYSLSDPKYAELLASRYIDGMNLYDIAEHLGYSHDWIRHQHGWALQAFQKEVLDRKEGTPS